MEIPAINYIAVFIAILVAFFIAFTLFCKYVSLHFNCLWRKDQFHWYIFIILDIQWQSHKYFWYFQITGEDSSEQADSGLGGGGECCSRYHNREAVDLITPSDDLHFAHRRRRHYNLCITCWTWSRPQSRPHPPWSAAWPAASRTSSSLQKRISATVYAFKITR